MPDNSKVENTNFIDNRDNSPMYKNEASDEITDSLKNFSSFDFYPTLYFFGIGNGHFYKRLLKKHKQQSIMIIEPELELLYITLNLVDFSQEILEKRVSIEHTNNIDKNYCIELLNNRLKFFLKVYDLHVHTHYYEKYFEDIKNVHNSFIDAFKYHIFAIGNSATDGTIGLEHSLQNTAKMLETPTLKELLKNGANSKTAIIVSTGPSLAKQLPLLKKIQNYVTILCIDASFPILSKEGIKPDIVFSIERVKESSEFYKKTPKKYHKDVIFALASVVHEHTVDNIHGEIAFFLRNDSYNTYFGLHDWSELTGGMSAANFTYDFAQKSNFEQIVIIGQDLAYGKDGSSHSKNHVFGENEVDEKKIFCHVDSYGGEGTVATTKVWKAFLDTYELQVKFSPTKTINATEGGARIKGTIEKSFQSISEQILEKKEIKNKIILKPLPSNKVEEIKEHYHSKLNEAIKMGKSIQSKSQKAYKEAALFLEKVENYSDKQIKKISFNILSKYVNEITNIKKENNSKEFAMMYSLLLQAYVFSVEFDVGEVYVMSENNDLAKKKKKIAWIKVHQLWFSRMDENISEILKILVKIEKKLHSEQTMIS